ncbi:unnamed protein product, partial [Ectocarpus fasciculatus]
GTHRRASTAARLPMPSVLALGALPGPARRPSASGVISWRSSTSEEIVGRTVEDRLRWMPTATSTARARCSLCRAIRTREPHR